MATSKKTPKAEPAAKKEAASADKSASTDTSKSADTAKTADAAKAADESKTVDAPKSEAADAGGAPKNYSRGEGQKAVTQAYRDNWAAIFGDKKNGKKKKR